MEQLRVLIVEDMPADAELAIYEIKKTLNNPLVKIVDNEPDFLDALDTFSPGLIISDYQMPTFNGLLALEHTLKKTPFTPFIVLTGSMNEETAVKCMKAGATDYVIKEHILRLGTSIESALHRKETEKDQFLARQELILYQEKLKKLTMELTLSEEKQRRRIASDIHDYISQSLVFSKIKIHELLSKNTDKVQHETLRQVHDLIAGALQRTRSITEDLSPPVLYELGLSEGISWLCEKIAAEHNLQITCNSNAKNIDIEKNVHIVIFRIIQELLINVVKHANATEVEVLIESIANNRIKFSVIDNGKGFNTNYNKTSKKTYGLFNIYEQIENLHGEITILNRDEGGVEISFILPQSNSNES